MQLQGLARIIQSFKPAECELIREYYLRKNNGSATKRLQLFDLLNNRLSKSSKQISRLLYNRRPDSGFSQLKKRLKEDLLDFLVFFSSNKGDRLNTENADLECRRLFVQAQTLVHKGIADEAVGVLKEVQRLARENDLPEMKAKTIALLQEISDQSFSDFKAGAKQVEAEFEIYLAQVRAGNLYVRLSAGEQADEWLEEDLELLAALEQMEAETTSSGLTYWYRFLSMLRSESEGQVARAYRHGLILNEQLQHEAGSVSKAQQFSFFLELARLLYQTGKHRKAELFARKAEMLCGNDCPDLLKVFGLRFLIHFCQEDLATCDELLSQARLHPELKSDENRQQIWLFFEACMHFKDHNFRVAQALLQQCTGLNRDRSGLFLEPRILELLNLIELQDFDLLEHKIESFRKLIEYHKDLCLEHVPRVMKVLKAFVRAGFDLEATYRQERELITELLYTTHYRGLVNVRTWLLAKLKVDDFKMVG